jgi:hypothetical protein
MARVPPRWALHSQARPSGRPSELPCHLPRASASLFHPLPPARREELVENIKATLTKVTGSKINF